MSSPKHFVATAFSTRCEGRRCARSHHFPLTLNLIDAAIDLFQARDDECGGLAGAVLRSCQHISAGKDNRNSFLLDRRRSLKALFENAHEKLALQVIVFELMTLRSCHILRRKGGKETGVVRKTSRRDSSKWEWETVSPQEKGKEREIGRGKGRGQMAGEIGMWGGTPIFRSARESLKT